MSIRRRSLAILLSLLLVLSALAAGCSSGSQGQEEPGDGYKITKSLTGNSAMTEKITLTSPVNRVRCQIEGEDTELKYQILDQNNTPLVIYGGTPGTGDVNDYNLQPGEYTIKCEAEAEFKVDIEEKFE